jgi:hypothetical protein
MLADAAQRYGMIVRDKAGVVAFYGEDPGRAADDPWRDALEGRPAAELLRPFPWDRLQLLRMELDTWGPP